jgi:hypothetical protein
LTTAEKYIGLFSRYCPSNFEENQACEKAKKELEKNSVCSLRNKKKKGPTFMNETSL